MIEKSSNHIENELFERLTKAKKKSEVHESNVFSRINQILFSNCRVENQVRPLLPGLPTVVLCQLIEFKMRKTQTMRTCSVLSQGFKKQYIEMSRFRTFLCIPLTFQNTGELARRQRHRLFMNPLIIEKFLSPFYVNSIQHVRY